MKIVDESILFFSLKILSRSSLHFVGIRIFIVGCVWNVKSQVSNKHDVLATRPHDWNELRANYLAKLKVLSCSATADVTLQLPCMLHMYATFGDLPIAKSSHEALLECTLLSFSSHSLTHYPYMNPT